MKPILTIAVAAAIAGAGAAANADQITATFQGTVQSQTNSGFALNAAVSGSFAFDTATAQFTSFSVGGQSVAAGSTSTAVITPDLYTALYQAQLSPVPVGSGANSTFTLDLEGINKWPSNNAVALLGNASVLATNLDKPASSFGYYTAAANGTGVRSLSAVLTSISVVPEPATWALWSAGIAALLVARRSAGAAGASVRRG